MMNPEIPQKISARQHQILEHLLENRKGLSVDELAKALDISRTGVQQHFVVLERDGYIKKSMLNKTGGRPVTIYVITDKGNNYFPKQYAWFSALVLGDLQQEMGAERFKAYMQKLGRNLADKLRERFDGKGLDERVDELVAIMAGLGFQVQVELDAENLHIKASNCVYHDLAQQHHEICAFDLALMSSLLDKDVEPLKCMAEGDCHCRFKIK
ncbi:MAG: HTH domain-containing protein [Methylobacter sp.]|nr:HTH domain-containing protein [Methylobacter sp.]MDP2428611.1 HTH domain-containing protein [Methylobacter sp.]MDP3056447.1 HTH domain-containing protein [Methylobacter sp.]MDP3363193.1 HTH domain-containing protein [Methylobacter sp.]MDZ4217902.1 HTH domain-containing protein [Methylobacter sp.]